jgi:hypothetical protein
MENILHKTMLRFMNILQHPQVHRLVIVNRKQCFLQAMNASVRNDNHIEKIRVKPNHEPQMKEQEDDRNSNDREMPAVRKVRPRTNKKERENNDNENKIIPHKTHKGQEQTKPVLMKIELE